MKLLYGTPIMHNVTGLDEKGVRALKKDLLRT